MEDIGSVAEGVIRRLPIRHCSIDIEVTGKVGRVRQLLAQFRELLAADGHRVDRVSLTSGIREDITAEAVDNSVGKVATA